MVESAPSVVRHCERAKRSKGPASKSHRWAWAQTAPRCPRGPVLRTRFGPMTPPRRRRRPPQCPPAAAPPLRPAAARSAMPPMLRRQGSPNWSRPGTCPAAGSPARLPRPPRRRARPRHRRPPRPPRRPRPPPPPPPRGSRPRPVLGHAGAAAPDLCGNEEESGGLIAGRSRLKAAIDKLLGRRQSGIRSVLYVVSNHDVTDLMIRIIASAAAAAAAAKAKHWPPGYWIVGGCLNCGQSNAFKCMHGVLCVCVVLAPRNLALATVCSLADDAASGLGCGRPQSIWIAQSRSSHAPIHHTQTHSYRVARLLLAGRLPVLINRRRN